MKSFEEIMSIGNVDLKGFAVERSSDSPLVMVKKKILVPERKIILMDQLTEQESQLLLGVNKNKGGWIV